MKMTIRIFRQYTLVLVVGSMLGLLFHLGLIGLDSMLLEKPVHLDPKENFWQSAFSFPFLPMLILEVFFSTIIIFLWITMKNAIHRAHELDLKRKNYEASVKTVQKIMALMGEHIAFNNNQILKKIEYRKKQGQQTSEAIENASRNISWIMKVLSEVSFIEPYLPSQQNRELDLLKELKRRMNEMNELHNARVEAPEYMEDTH